MQRNGYVLFGHVLLATAAVLMVMQTVALTQPFPGQNYYLALVFCSTLGIYRLAYHGLKYPLNYRMFLRNKAPLFFLACAFLFSFFLKMEEVIGLLLMGLACLFYFVQIGVWKGLRTHPVIKSIWLALVWTMVTAVIPLYPLADRNELSIVAERFLFMLAICIVYNLRDLNTDKQQGIITIPMSIGVSRTKLLAVFILIINAVLVLCNSYSMSVQFTLLFSLVFTTVIIYKTKAGGHPLYYSLALDGSMIVQSLLVFSAKML